jgi:metal-responsive CopG/Arc/MetJ family transcriptional regulator
MAMKPIQVVLDSELLSQLDENEEVRRDGRSAVVRRALSEYLERGRAAQIRDRYRAAYGTDAGLGAEFEGWEAEGVWPSE